MWIDRSYVAVSIMRSDRRFTNPKLPLPVVRPWALLKQLVPRGHLRVTRILEFDPVGASAVRVIATVRRLRHDALEIVGAGDLEEVSATFRDVVHVQEPGRH
jgi:hypothetical protein